MTNQPAWITIQRAAIGVDRSPRTVRRWIQQGRLDAYRVNGQVWVRIVDVLVVEVATRQAAKAGRPGARPNLKLTA